MGFFLEFVDDSIEMLRMNTSTQWSQKSFQIALIKVSNNVSGESELRMCNKWRL